MKLFKRENYLSKMRGFFDAADIVKVITGVRRCGKSSLMATVADEVRSRGASEENIIFLDLDRRELMHVTTPEQLDAEIAARSTAKGLKYLFIDEVQNVEEFEKVVNAYRMEGDFSIFLTGSNSYLLSGELATKLTGRYLEFEMFPLSFEEHLQMKEFYGMPAASPQVELDAYLLGGGFPRALFLEDARDRRTYVAGVVDEIFQKDIRRRVKIRNRASFEAVRAFMVNNFGATFSIDSLHAALVACGMTIARATVERYIQTLIDAKVLYTCERFDMKSKRALKGEKKYYLSDLGFYFTMNTDNRINYGPALENAVYLYARSKGYSASVGRIGSLECDFILRSPEMDYSYVQVAYTILASRDTEEREYRPLERIRDNYPKYVMTTDTLLQKRNGVIHANLPEFMASGRLF